MKTNEFRTSVPMALGFKNFYVYSAVSSSTGVNFHLVLPSVDTQCMNAYLKEFSEFLRNKKIFLVLDGAGWHKSNKLNIPENIMFINLPAYSPELNPTERLWEYIKDNVLKNRVYQNIDALMDIVANFIKNLTNLQIMQTCSCNYLDT